MDLTMPKSMHELMHTRIALVIGTALMTTAVLCAYYVMHNADGYDLLSVAVTNLISTF